MAMAPKRKRPAKAFTKSKKPKGDYQKGRELAKPTTELKAFDLAQLAVNFETPAGAVFHPLNTIVNGAELYQRVGRKTYMKSLQIRGLISPVVNTLATQTLADMGRIVVVYDSQPNAALAVIGDLFRDSTAAAASDGLSMINLNNRERFKILRDHEIWLSPYEALAGNVYNIEPVQDTMNKFSFNMFIPLKGLETVYNAANGGTIADITSGAILIAFISNLDADHWKCNYTTRLRYYD